MRVELIYSPGCRHYKKILNRLELVIAEERLPVPVELVEETLDNEPQVRIAGETVNGAEILSCLERMRESISAKWSEYAQCQASERKHSFRTGD